MMISGGGYAPPISYLFIDGDNLRHMLALISDRFFDGEEIPVSWNQMRNPHRKVFYYDAIPVKGHQEDDTAYGARIAPKLAELAAIERQVGYNVRSGDAIHRRKRGNEQKVIDVQLAVDALSMASRGLFSAMTLITSDLDFKPLISALVEMGIDVTLRYSRGETNEDLIAAADAADPITIANCVSWIEPTFLERHPMPRAEIAFQRPQYLDAPAIVQWHDQRHGDCRIIQQDNGLLIVTEREPYNPNTHRLELRHSNAVTLRAWAREVHGMDVPEW